MSILTDRCFAVGSSVSMGARTSGEPSCSSMRCAGRGGAGLAKRSSKSGGTASAAR